MEFFSKLSISVFVSIVKRFGKLTFSELQKDQKFFKFLNEHNLVKPKDEFESLYLFSLVRFSEKVTNQLFLEVFKHKNAVLAFKENQRKNNNAYARTLNQILLTDPEICKNPDLKKFSQIPDIDIICFEEIYKQLLNEIKSPLQLEDSNRTVTVIEAINELKNKVELLSKAGNTGEVIFVIQSLIDDYKVKIFDELNFSASLELLNSLENYLPTISFLNGQQNLILSRIYFLQGWCLLLLNDTDNQIKFIKAHEFSPHITEYKEWATISYCKKNLKESAEILANEIVKTDFLSAKAYSVLKVLNSESKIPEEVLNEQDFKYHYINLLLRSNVQHELIHNFFDSDFQNLIPIQEVNNLEDFLYKNLILSFYFERILNQCFTEHSLYFAYKELGKSPQIKLCIDSYMSLLSYSKKSKDFTLILHFTDANWLMHFCSFIKNFDEKSAFELYNAFQILANKKDKFRFESTLFALSQTKQYDLVTELGTKFEIPDKINNIGIADAIYKYTGDKNKCKELLIDYCESISEINQSLVHNFTIVLELYKHIDESPSELFSKYLSTKQFEREEIKRILELYGNVLDTNNILFEKDYLVGLSKNIANLNDSSKILLAILLYHISEYKISNVVISQIHEFKKIALTFRLYIDNLISLEEKTEELLELLSEFRNIEIDYKFLFCEIDLFYKISDFESIYNLAKLGCSKFPQIAYFFYSKVISLYYLENDIELLEILDESIVNRFNFGWQNAFSLAKICAEKGKDELALEIAFKYTKENYDNSLVKDTYFQFYLFCIKQTHPKAFENITIGTYVSFKINNELKIKLITGELIKTRIYQEFIGKGVGVFNFRQNLEDDLITIEILEITDKYRGLFLEISNEINTDPFSGSKIIAIKAPSGDIEEFNKILIKKFGAEGGINKRLRNDQFIAYREGKISFSELVHFISNDSYFDIYYHLRNYERFVLIPPSSFLANLTIDKSAKYVLDIPSIILFSDLYDDISIKFGQKFIISSYAKEYFKILLKEERNTLKTNMSMDILETNIRLIKHPENQQEIRIRKLENIIKWIENNCHIGHAKNKLEILTKLDRTDFENYSFGWEYTIDTLFLSNQANFYLITDDLFFYKFFGGTIVPLSTEFFLRKEFNDTQKIISKLLDYNMVGISLSSSQLIYEFDKNPILETNDNPFLNAIRSLDFRFSGTKDNFNQAIVFIKYIYSLGLQKKFTKRISQLVLHTVLCNYPLELKDRRDFTSKIKSEFYLLGNNDIEVMDDLTSVMDIIIKTRRKCN